MSYEYRLVGTCYASWTEGLPAFLLNLFIGADLGKSKHRSRLVRWRVAKDPLRFFASWCWWGTIRKRHSGSGYMDQWWLMMNWSSYSVRWTWPLEAKLWCRLWAGPDRVKQAEREKRSSTGPSAQQNLTKTMRKLLWRVGRPKLMGLIHDILCQEEVLSGAHIAVGRRSLSRLLDQAQVLEKRTWSVWTILDSGSRNISLDWTCPDKSRVLGIYSFVLRFIIQTCRQHRQERSRKHISTLKLRRRNSFYLWHPLATWALKTCSWATSQLRSMPRCWSALALGIPRER